MQTIDLTVDESVDEYSSFGSQETDDDSVVFLVETADISSDEDEDINEIGDSETGNVID
jgi:hypothetical protein